jgi:hypothetical protein
VAQHSQSQRAKGKILASGGHKMAGQNAKGGTMTDNELTITALQVIRITVLQVIRTLCNSSAIGDTIWMPNGNVTAVEELCSVASALGASDDDIEEATQGNREQVQQ